MSDEPDVVTDVSERFAQRAFDAALLQLSANIIRVVRGAGRPYDVILQCSDVLQAALEVKEKTGRVPSDAAVANTLMLKHEEVTEYESFRSQRKLAMEQMISGALRVAAARMLDQRLQIDHGEKEMQSAYLSLDRVYEELRKKREVEAKKRRAKTAPRRKPAKRKV